MRPLFVAVGLAIGSVCRAQDSVDERACQSSPTARDLCTTDSLLTDATRRNDVRVLSRIYAEDYHFTTYRGSTSDKAAQLRAFSTAEMHYDSATVFERRIRVYGDAAVVTGRRRQVATVRGERRPSDVRITRVYIRRNDEWQLVAGQVTPILAVTPSP